MTKTLESGLVYDLNVNVTNHTTDNSSKRAGTEGSYYANCVEQNGLCEVHMVIM